MRLFLDANILFSAAWRDEAHALILFRLDRTGRCRLITSRLAAEEARRNIAHKRAGRLDLLNALIGQIIMGKEPGPEQLELASRHRLPEKDIPILAAAVGQQADLLVTGDRRDFGHLYGQRIADTEVVGLARAIERILQAHRS
ncbi:MAG: PIN domain-containing protein [Wenzhouxiangellaceae bacterium]